MSIVDSRSHFNTLKNWIRNPNVPNAHEAGKPPLSFDYYIKNNLNGTKTNGRKTKNADANKAGESTHFLLRGGIWEIPADANDHFLWHYAISLMQNEENTVVEKRTNHFRYHLDFDFADVQPITLNEFKKYVSVVQEVLQVFYCHSQNVCFECTVSMSDTKEIEPKIQGAPKLIKSGFHVIFHNIWVDADKALAIRAYLITKIRSKFGERDTTQVNDWEDIVDESIYIKNGLRMIGSQKYHACKCNAKSKKKNQKFVPPVFPFVKEKVTSAATSSSSSLSSSMGSTGATNVKDNSGSGNQLSSSQSGVRVENDDNAQCDKCHNTGYIFEGRPYFVVAAWDHKCETITRKVKVSKLVTADVPCFQKANNTYIHPEWFLPFEDAKLSEEKLGVMYWAMPHPNFGPDVKREPRAYQEKVKLDLLSDDEDMDDDDDLVDYRQLGKLNTASKMDKLMAFRPKANDDEVDTEDYMYVPFCDLIVFGNPRSQELEQRFKNDPWKLVRLFHNTLRLVTLRMHPDDENELSELEEKIRVDEKHGKTYLPTNYPPSPFPIFVKPALSVPFARYEAVVERMNKESGKPLKVQSKRRVEGLNEFRNFAGKKEKVFITEEVLLDDVQAFIRENVGIRIQEPKQPYGQIDVIGIYHNYCPTRKPTAYMVQVRGIGASFCFNKNGDHNSNGIYFKITKKGLSQRCFCTCAETHGRVTGKPCKEYEGKLYPLPKRLKNELFPKTKVSAVENMMDAIKSKNVDPSSMRMSVLNIEPLSFSSDLGKPEDLAKEFEEFLRRKREREEKEGFEDPSKRNKVF
jgi:hypothetical protein